MAILIRGGLVVTLDEKNQIFEDGEILVEDDEIRSWGLEAKPAAGHSRK